MVVNNESAQALKLILNPEAIALINDTLKQNISTDRYPIYAQGFDQFLCGLPPMVRDERIIDLAEQGLRGNVRVLDEFQRHLNEFFAWNQQVNPLQAISLDYQQHQNILSKTFLDKFFTSHSQSGSSLTLFHSESMAILTGAAMASAGQNAVAINHNIGIIFDQFCGLNILNRLYQQALSIKSRPDLAHSFVQNISLLGGAWEGPPGGGFGLNEPPGFDRFPLPNNPSDPLPWDPNRGGGGLPSWPPDPFGPADPTLPGGLECLPEALRAFVDVIGPGLLGLRYEITEIEPLDACVGETLTIRGNHFTYEDETPVVRFYSGNVRDPIIATPSSVNDHEIQVQVPPGARCGPLELALTTPITVLACGATVTLDLIAEAIIDFQGGETWVSRLGFLPKHCFSAGDTIRFNFAACNAQTLRITAGIAGDSAEPLLIDETYNNEWPLLYPLIVPNRDSNTRYVFRVTATGRCGEDTNEVYFSVRRGLPVTDTERRLISAPIRFRNWNHNIDFLVPQAVPSTLEELVSSILVAEDIPAKVAIAGSGFSFTNCMVSTDTSSEVLIDSCALSQILLMPNSEADVDDISFLSAALREDAIESVMSRAALNEYACVLDEAGVSPIRNRLAHIEGGVKLKVLNQRLQETQMALATMGGGQEQSLVGALSTGTHGSTLRLPPIADFVRAIHLVSSGGQQWWIEPSSMRITDREKMEALRGNALDTCIRIEYDDSLFYSTLISLGAAGVIYSVVYEVIDAHNLRYKTMATVLTSNQELPSPTRMTRESFANYIQERFIDNETRAICAEGEPQAEREGEILPAWFNEILIGATGMMRITTAELTSLPATPCMERDHSRTTHTLAKNAWEDFLPFLSGLSITWYLGTAVPVYIARQSAKFARYTATFRWRKAAKLAARIVRIREISRGAIGSYRVILAEDDSRTRDIDEQGEVVYRELPNLINALWELGFVADQGREIVDLIQNKIMVLERKVRDDILRSDLALMGQNVPYCDEDEVSVPCPSSWNTSDGFSRLVESHEYVLPARQAAAFVFSILDVVEEMRNREFSDAVLLALPMRFTLPTKARLGMQRPTHDISCHIEIFVMERLLGTAELLFKVREIAERFNAIPHWGQLHNSGRDFERLYGVENINGWQAAMEYIVDNSPGRPDTFRKQFTRERGLTI